MRVSGFRSVVSIAVFAVCVGALTAPAATGADAPVQPTLSPVVAAVEFSDVDGTNPFAADIAWLAEQGITTGYSDGTFRPTGSVNRDAMAAFLYRLQVGPDAPAACTEGPFADVTAAHPFCPHITWLVGEGITTGYADGTFRPSSSVSREAMAAFLYRVAHDGAKAPACTAAPFTDVPAAALFCGEITWLAEQEVTTGWADGTFRPGASIERQAMAAFLHRFAALTPPEPPVDPLAPQVLINTPMAGSMLSGTATVSTSWSVTSPLSRVNLFVDGEPVAEVEADPFEPSWDTTGVADGAHLLTVTATDADGRTGESAPVAVIVHQGPDPLALLEADYAAGTITPEDFARYAVYRWFEPQLVPEAYQLPEGYGSEGDLTVPLAGALRDFEALDPDVQQELDAYLAPPKRPDAPVGPLGPDVVAAAMAPYLAALEGTEGAEGSSLQQTGLAGGAMLCVDLASAVWLEVPDPDDRQDPGMALCRYSTPLADFSYEPGSGAGSTLNDRLDSVDFLLRGSDDPNGGPNGIPDQLDEINLAFIDAYSTYQSLGYGDIDHIEVEVGSFQGRSLPNDSMRVDKDQPVYLARHELFHQFQFKYTHLERLGLDYTLLTQNTTGWWLEATAEWATHQAQEEQWPFLATLHEFMTDDARAGYHENLTHHLDHAWWSLGFNIPAGPFLDPLLPDDIEDVGPQYGAFLFAEYLEEHFGRNIILNTWIRSRDHEARPIDAIAAILELQQATTLADVVRAYHAANYGITDTYEDLDRSKWSDRLTDDVPRGIDVPVVTNRAITKFGKVQPGGTLYFGMDLGAIPHGAVATVQVDVLEGTTEDLYVQYVAAATAGRPGCDRDAGFGGPFDGSRHSSRALIMEGCPRMALAITDTEPRDIGDDAVEFTVTVTFEQINTVGFWAARPELASPFRAVDAVGAARGSLLLTDGDLAGYDIGCTWDLCESTWEWGSSTVQIARPAGQDATLALDTSGRVHWTAGSRDQFSATSIPELEFTAQLVTDYRDVARYAVKTDGTMVLVGGGYPEVTGAEGVLRAAGREWMDQFGVMHRGGYAVTESGGLLYITDEAAVPIPEVPPVADVAMNTWGDAFVIHTDGTMSMIAERRPTVAMPAQGITDARAMFVPEAAGGTVVLTGDDAHMYFVDDGIDGSQAVVVDSGVVGVVDVAVGYSSAPAWVIADGQFLKPYVEWGATTGEIRFEASAITQARAVEDGGCRYVMRLDGTIASSGCYNVPPTVPGITGATGMFCTGEGQCFATFE